MPLWFRNEKTREMYAEETPEVIEEVAKRAEEAKGNPNDGDDEDDGLDPAVVEKKRLAKLEGYRMYAAPQLRPT